MFGRALTIGTVRGIAIRVDVSWILIALLVTWNFWARFRVADDHPSPVALAMAVAGAAIFFGSILAHELAHALEAQHRGVTVAGITLFVFGGVTESRFDVRRPVDEFALTAVGPFTSFVIAAVLGLAATSAGELGWDVVADLTGVLAWINVALGVFNLLPGAPLDGGRILRSLVWKVTGDRGRATRVASRSGQVIGGALIALGLLQFFLVPGAPAGGLWLAIIGWFLFQAARAELSQVELDELLEGRTAGSLVPRDTEPISASATLAEAVSEHLSQSSSDAFVVVDEQGGAVGVLGVDAVRRVPRSERDSRQVADIMRPFDDVPERSADDPATELIEPLQHAGVVVVTEGQEVLGVITPSRLVAFLNRASQLEGRRTGAASR